MPSYWCECRKCNGGKAVGRSTWFLHKRLERAEPTPYSRSAGSGTQAHADPLNVSSHPARHTDVREPSGDIDLLDNNRRQVIGSDDVSEMH